MAYDTANPLALASQRVGASGGAIFIYKDGDDVDTVTAVNYVTNANDLGVVEGDRVIHIDETNLVTTDLVVLSSGLGTASGALGSAIEPIGETSIALQSAGTGTIVIDDIIVFDNHLTEYRITTGDTDVSDGGTLVITPALTAATAVGTGIKIKSNVFVLSSGAVGGQTLASSPATRTLSAAESGSTVLFDAVAGQVFTLPAPVIGLEFDFTVTASLTSNAYTVDTDAGTTFIVGSLQGAIEALATDETHFANGTTHIGISMNKTTTGGLVGGSFKMKCISATLWQITGNTSCTATPATPFTT